MTEPKCPECGVQGMNHITSQHSIENSGARNAWFEVAYCDDCGHIYGVFPKHVFSHQFSAPPRGGIPI